MLYTHEREKSKSLLNKLKQNLDQAKFFIALDANLNKFFLQIFQKLKEFVYYVYTYIHIYVQEKVNLHHIFIKQIYELFQMITLQDSFYIF